MITQELKDKGLSCRGRGYNCNECKDKHDCIDYIETDCKETSDTDAKLVHFKIPDSCLVINDEARLHMIIKSIKDAMMPTGYRAIFSPFDVTWSNNCTIIDKCEADNRISDMVTDCLINIMKENNITYQIIDSSIPKTATNNVDGCEYCHDYTKKAEAMSVHINDKNKVWYTLYEHYMEVIDDRPEGNIMSFKIKYCPNCGRKLE